MIEDPIRLVRPSIWLLGIGSSQLALTSNYQKFIIWWSRLICGLRRGCKQLTYLPRLSFEFQVVKTTSSLQKVDQ